jgi:REP element-mobilizing transposase RayT
MDKVPSSQKPSIMQKFEPLDFGKSYHIYNKGINGEEIFLNCEHYEKFLRLYEKYIDEIADTFAWCLMKNHFHFLIRIKEQELILSKKSNEKILPKRFDSEFLSRQFGNLFNAYSQSFNNRTKRTGGLFQTPFRRKLIETDDYFTTLIFYIHNNPVKHGICKRIQDYPWSSYATIISFTPTRLQRDKVIGWFEGKTNFVAFHEGEKTNIDITHLIFERP